MARMEGAVAIVTGGGCIGEGPDSGIGNGRATCIRLAEEGAAVIVLDRDEPSAKRTVVQIAERGGQAISFGGDVTNEADCQEATAVALERFGRLDVLVNNVGIPGEASTVVDVADWDRVLDVNLKSVMLMSRYAIPAMRRNGGGAIVNLASIAAFRQADRIAYAASKGGVLTMTMAMAGQHANEGIRVNCVAPGQVWNPNVADTFGGETTEIAARRERRRLSSLMKTEGTGWDIANAVLFFASSESKFVTGQTLLVDGGLHIGRPPAVA
jgi:NAD(P)-dependent dehydrogenase (short-subunit alcohol dehydrogenase family)